MREAARIYSKSKAQDKTSSIFKSSVEREGIQGVKRLSKAPGPGEYEVTLPLVKPKYEAIIKKNRSIIIKVNDVQMPGFCSKEPRFKQFATIHNDEPLDLSEF